MCSVFIYKSIDTNLLRFLQSGFAQKFKKCAVEVNSKVLSLVECFGFVLVWWNAKFVLENSGKM